MPPRSLQVFAAAAAGLAAWWAAATLGVVSDTGQAAYVFPQPRVSLVAFSMAAAVVQWHAGPAAVLALLPLIAPLLAPSWAGAWVYAGWGVSFLWVSWASGAVAIWAPRRTWRPDWDVPAAAVAAAIWLGGAAFAAAPVALTGDAPHYLAMTQSVLSDGDLDLRNNYDERTYTAFYRGGLEPRHTNVSPWGQQYSFHGPGVAVFVLPGFALAGVGGATAMLVLLLAAGAGLFWALAKRVTGSRSGAWFAWAALVTSAPYTLHAVAIYPDGPAAVAVIAAVWLLVAARDGSLPLVTVAACSVGLAALPWLHPRLALPAGILGAAIGVALLRQSDRWTKLLWFLMVPIISATGWFAAAYVMFDTWNPAAAILQRTAPGGWAESLTGLAGLLADLEFGLCPTSPVMLAAPIGWLLLARRDGALGAATGLTALGVWAMSSFWVWWGGDAAPARFLTVVLPVFGLWVGVAWTESGAPIRRLLIVAVAAGAAFTALLTLVDGGSHAFNFPDGRYSIFDTLSTSVNVSAALPSFVAPGRQLPIEFATAALWLIAVAGLALGVRQLRLAAPLGWAVTTLAAVGVVAVASAGAWRLRHADPWARGTAALSLLRAVRSPAPPIVAGIGLRLFDATTLARALRLRTPESIGRPADAWLYVPTVPAGTYLVEARGLDDTMGDLTLQIGRDAWPIATWRAGQTPPAFSLPVAVHSVRVSGTGAARAEISLAVAGGPAGKVPVGEARRMTRVDALDVYAMDDSSYGVGESELWTAGNRPARLVVATPGRGRVTAHIEAGPTAIPVEVVVTGQPRPAERSLAAGTRLDLPLGVAGPGAPLDVTITARGSFPAALLGNTRDARQLGVKVSFDVKPE